MAADIENQHLAEWLQVMGCPIDLSPEDLQKINTVNMRSVWRHLRRHVMPVQHVQTVRKNLLLEEVNQKNLQPGRFGNFKVESLHDLAQIQNLSELKEELNLVKDKIKTVDDQLLTASTSFVTKLTEKECLKSEVLEEEKKVALLNLKLKSVKNDDKKFDKEMETVCVLETFPTPVLGPELKDIMLKVSSLVNKYSLCENPDDHDDCINEMILLTLSYPPSTIFNGIFSASNRVLKSLKINVDFDMMTSLNFGASSLFQNLNGLCDLVYKTKVELFSRAEKVKEEKVHLDKEKAVLVKAVRERLSENCSDSIVEFIEKLLQQVIVKKSLEKTREVISDLDTCSSDFHYKKSYLHNLGDQESELLKEVDKIVVTINDLIFKITTSKVSSLRSEVQEKCSDIVSNFLSEVKHKKEEKHTDIFHDSEDLIKKETDMFQKSSLVALSRKWEDVLETVPSGLQVNIFKNQRLLCFLLQSEPKNLIKSVLEKLYWSDSHRNQ